MQQDTDLCNRTRILTVFPASPKSPTTRESIPENQKEKGSSFRQFGTTPQSAPISSTVEGVQGATGSYTGVVEGESVGCYSGIGVCGVQRQRYTCIWISTGSIFVYKAGMWVYAVQTGPQLGGVHGCTCTPLLQNRGVHRLPCTPLFYSVRRKTINLT